MAAPVARQLVHVTPVTQFSVYEHIALNVIVQCSAQCAENVSWAGHDRLHAEVMLGLDWQRPLARMHL